MNEVLAQILDSKLDEGFKLFAGTETKFVSDIIKDFKNIYKNEIAELDISEVYNSLIDEWYNGTIIHKLLLYIFQPYLFTNTQEQSSRFDLVLTKVQIYDILRTIYDFITHKECDPTHKDYYENNALEALESFDTIEKLPICLAYYLPCFGYIIRNSENVVELQQKMIRVYLKKRLIQKRNAVKVFEKYFLEVLLNPYNICGKRKVEKLAMNFNILNIVIKFENVMKITE